MSQGSGAGLPLVAFRKQLSDTISTPSRNLLHLWSAPQGTCHAAAGDKFWPNVVFFSLNVYETLLCFFVADSEKCRPAAGY